MVSKKELMLKIINDLNTLDKVILPLTKYVTVSEIIIDKASVKKKSLLLN